jgi:hypothetical protein
MLIEEDPVVRSRLYDGMATDVKTETVLVWTNRGVVEKKHRKKHIFTAISKP